MENFLPALLIIGGVIYKIYSEYQKEQEKARRRMPQTPPSTQPQEVFEQRPQPPVIEPTISLPIPAIPKEEYARNMAVEVRKAKEKAQTAVNRATKTAPRVVTIDSEKEETASFNLREAVIQSAILHRPYQ